MGWFFVRRKQPASDNRQEQTHCDLLLHCRCVFHGGWRVLSDVVEIQLHGVWLAGVRGADVAYWACKKCKTKVGQETGCCKKQSTHGCATEQEDSRAILATVHLADWTGQLDNLLVNEAALCELTGFKTAELLLTEVDRHGTVALCFRHRCDVRVATSHKHKQWSGSAASQSTASTQLSP